MGDFDFIQIKKEKLQKQSKTLTIVGGVFTAITLVLEIIFLLSYLKFATSTADGNAQLEGGLSLVLLAFTFFYCVVPSFVTGVVSLIVNLVAIKKSKKYLILDIVFAVLTFLAIAIFIACFVHSQINQQTPAETAQIFNAIKALNLIG